MKNIVISLDSASERREHIKNEFGKHNLSYEFFDALRPDQAKEYAERLNINSESSLTPTELACMMSHVAVWEKIIEEELPYATVFEDDVFLGEDAEALLTNSNWIQPYWNIIKIEAFSKKAYLSSKTYNILPNKRELAILEGKNLGAAGYILSLQGAKLFLDFILTHPAQPVDRMIFSDFIDSQDEPIYQMLPALCEQEKILKKKQDDKRELRLPSSLTAERKERRKLEKKKGLSKLQREASRLVRNTKKQLFAKKITFK